MCSMYLVRKRKNANKKFQMSWNEKELENNSRNWEFTPVWYNMIQAFT